MGDDRGGVAGIVLAAGQSTRAGVDQKLLTTVDGDPMVVRVVKTALEVELDPVIVVTGHRGAQVEGVIRAATGEGAVTLVRNLAPAEGIARSIALGVEALPPTVGGVVILLGDMPWVRPATIRRLVATFRAAGGEGAVVPRVGGRRGNPVLWSARHFDRLRELRGDRGARDLLAERGITVRWVDVDDPGVLRDVDHVASP